MADGSKKTPLNGKNIIVLGAGIVGVCTALEFQRRGAKVTLIDRKAPGCETSFGNAGVFARSSLYPLNNPELLPTLPKLLGNRTASLRYDLRYLLRNAPWAIRFLLNARASRCEATSKALDNLIRRSIDGHKRLIKDCDQSAMLSDRGWLFLYRTDEAFQKTKRRRAAFAQFGVETEVLSSAHLSELEPHIQPAFEKALWIKDSYSVNDPGGLVEAYARHFVQKGGSLQVHDLRSVAETDSGAVVHVADGQTLPCDHAVICLGPWGKTFLENAGFKVQMAYERGYHLHFSGVAPATKGSQLGRPICDVSGGFVLSPMTKGLRLTSGVELNDQSAAANHTQLAMAEAAARSVIDLGAQLEKTPWMGCRPTFPDSRPAIGPLPRCKNLSVAFGHQHMGLGTAPGTAELLADLIENKPPCIAATPFRPDRYIHKKWARSLR